jgi:putative GTP pyrophosphokinase
VEIQLRTIGMDFWASLEHKLSYKKSLPRELEQELSAQLLECANRVSELDMQMQRIRDCIEKNLE